ncbi:hypothetical protein E2C01_065790 [Portunus trituberculatus]|uniref:Uncharacterized protein n=1 Tax=Portunus trituberculatus TaxID=210409 RepID=A0A5B7HN17_PORTR|nr:hypothetical protein [Portunus trituberculatus]
MDICRIPRSPPYPLHYTIALLAKQSRYNLSCPSRATCTTPRAYAKNLHECEAAGRRAAYPIPPTDPTLTSLPPPKLTAPNREKETKTREIRRQSHLSNSGNSENTVGSWRHDVKTLSSPV